MPGGASSQSAGTAAEAAGTGTAPAILTGPLTVTGQDPAEEGRAEDGYRSTTGSFGPFGKAPLKDIPLSVNVTPGALIENTNAHSLADALRTSPTATMLMSSAGYSSMARMMVRGFTAADQSEMRDGLVDRSFSYPPIENVERIEVLNGFSGFLHGFSALGGTVDYVSKQPTPAPLASVSAGRYGGGIDFTHADLGGPVPGTDGRLGYRVNAYHEDGSTYVEGSSQTRTLLSARVHYDVRDSTRLWADVWHQDYEAQGLQTYVNLGSGVRVPAASAFDPTRQYGQPWTTNKADKTVVGGGFDSRLADALTVRAGYRYGRMWRAYDYVGATLTSASGSYSERYTNTPRQNETTHSAYALMDVEATTWGIGHTITLGYTGTDYSYDRGDDVALTLGNSTVASPRLFADPSAALGGTTTWQSQYLDNVMIGDRIVLTDRLSALVGATHATLRQTARGSGTVISTSNYRSRRLSPSAALLFKPHPDVSLYASTMEALVGGESTSSTTAVNRNQVLKPSVSRQYETGAKATLGGMDVSAALFRIDKVNAEIDPADRIFKQDGREIHQGIEVTAGGKLTEDLTLIGGFTRMDAHIEKALANPATEGRTPVNVPERQARLYAEYAPPFLPDVTVTGGVNYYGRRPVDALNTDYLKAATTFDAGLRYEPTVHGHRIAASLTATNLFDKRYWAYYRSGDGLLLGAPQIISLSVRATW